MNDVRTEAVEPAPGVSSRADLGLIPAFAVAVVAGAGLVLAARAGATDLVVAVAVVQAAFACAWVLGTSMPGTRGGLIIGLLAAAGADVGVMVRPHERLGVLLTVLGLTIPAIFVHQLMRGAARVRIVASMSAVATLAFAEIALPALIQIRHDFSPAETGGKVAAAAAAALAGALAVGYATDLVLPSPRFDADVPRGLPAVVLSAGVGAALAYLMLEREPQLSDGRAVFFGAALGALAALLAVVAAFVLHTTSAREGSLAARLRPVISALLPLMVLAPVAFLLSVAIRA